MCSGGPGDVVYRLVLTEPDPKQDASLAGAAAMAATLAPKVTCLPTATDHLSRGFARRLAPS
jgi:hypothetical protein